MKIYLPLDSAAVALGADEIAHAIEKHAHAKGVAVTLVRNGSRGMVWLEPMVEVEGPKGRLAFGPMTLSDVPALFGDLSAHPKALGLTELETALGEELHADADAQERLGTLLYCFGHRLYHASPLTQRPHTGGKGPDAGQHEAISRRNDLGIITGADVEATAQCRCCGHQRLLG